jgi:small-conductance mechanosensitive channel
MTRLEHRRVLMVLNLVYNTPVERLAALPEELKAIVERQPGARFDRAHLIAFAASSIDLELVFFADAPDYASFMNARQAVMLGILHRFAELGIDFAYPTQTTLTAAPDGRLIMPYPAVQRIAEADCDPD